MTTLTLNEKMAIASMKYAGEATAFCRFVEHGTIMGVSGRWILHEHDGQKVFQPFTTDRGYHNTATYELARTFSFKDE